MDIKTHQVVMHLIKSDSISYVLAKTDKGELTLRLRKGDDDWQVCLDAVPLEEEAQVKIKKLYQIYENGEK